MNRPDSQVLNPNHNLTADAIRCTVTELGGLPTSDARFFNALSFVLTRIADADQNIAPEEAMRMERVLEECADLSTPQAVLVVEIAKHRARLADTATAYTQSRQLRQHLDPSQRAKLLECLFAVADADGDVSVDEHSEIHQVAAELGFTRQEVESAGRIIEA